MLSHWQLIYYIRLFFICQELFQNFFRSFWSRSFKNQTFLTAVSFETSYLLYQTEIRLSRTFLFFSSRFSVWPSRLSATALIEYHSTPPPVNKNFQFFSNSEIAILHPLRAKSENQFCLCGRHPADHRHGQYQCRNRIYHSRVFLYSPKHYQNLIHK